MLDNHKTRYFIFIICILSCIGICKVANSITINTKDNYLSKPTGQYRIGFEDFHWINKDVCPDPIGSNKYDFSPENKNRCHEVMVRIYYPTIQSQPRSFYYKPFVEWQKQEFLKQVPAISKEQLDQFSLMRSFSIEKAEIVKGKKFPILFFSPGGGYPAQAYENFITELVSHGYIVVGINTPFVNFAALANGHLIMSGSEKIKNKADMEALSVPLQLSDLTYVFKRVRNLSFSNAFDLHHIGLFGHSIGARVLADFSHAHPTWIQAAATMDIGFDTTDASRMKFMMPFMHLVSAHRKLEPSSPTKFELGNKGYLVVVSPNKQNHDYSYHMSFSDLSTLQYLPAYKIIAAYLKKQSEEEFDLKFMDHEPMESENNIFNKLTYVLIKNKNKWDIEFFKFQKNQSKGPYRFINGVKEMKGLDRALASLSNKKIELLSASDVLPIKKAIFTFQRTVFSQPLANSNGWELTDSINENLIQFFDTYLKGEVNPAFVNCTALSKNTYIKCGPGNFNIR
jgi:hypothetical protein